MTRKPTYEELEQWVRIICLFFLIICLNTFYKTSSVQANQKKSVLILHSYHMGLGWTNSITNGMEYVFNESNQELELFFEYMDTKRIFDEEHLQTLLELYRHKFRNRKFDVIISSDDHAFNFLIAHHQELFSGTPIVFCGVNRFDDSSLIGINLITGIVESVDMKSTIDIALLIHPNTKQVYIVVDKTVSGIANKRLLMELIPHFKNTIEFTFLEDLDMSEVQERIGALPSDSIVLLANFTHDKSGNVFSHEESTALISKYSKVPVYSFWDTNLGHGITGGMLTSGYAQGEIAAKIAIRILNGENVENIPVVKKSPNRPMFDYKQMKHFGIKLSDLPKGSTVINEPSSFYSQHKGLIWSIVASIVGFILVIFVLSINILKRKRTEEALRESEEQLSNAMEIAHLGHWEYDVANDLFTFNDQFYGIFRTTAKQVGGYTMSSAEYARRFVHPDDMYMVEEETRKAIEATDPHINRLLEHRILYGDGTVGYIVVRFFLVKDSQNRTVKTYGVNQDITERNRLAEEREKLETQLRQAQKMESIGTLAGGIAHDFNNILFPIVGYAEMTMDDVPEDSTVYKNLKEILSSALRARDLVQQILTFSRKQDKELKPLKAQIVVREALKLIRSSLPTTIEIRQDIDKDCGPVMADPTQIHQVVMNLCTNAYHAMDETGGALEVSLNEVELTVDDLSGLDMEPGPYLCLKVGDTGHGMDQSVIDRIFDPYFTTKETGKGTGLGLSVVHGIIKSYGGDIRVYSEPGKGTVFHVYLPLIKETDVSSEPVSDEALYTGHERVLLVDDEAVIVSLEKQMVESLGYHVTSRTSSVEALEAFREQPEKFDVVITDMTMPNMTGDRLAAELMKIRPDIPIILCTGFSEKISKERADTLGIKGFLMKPIVKKDLAKTIHEVLKDIDKGDP